VLLETANLVGVVVVVVVEVVGLGGHGVVWNMFPMRRLDCLVDAEALVTCCSNLYSNLFPESGVANSNFF